MSEKRKPTIKIVAVKRGKRHVLEFFPAHLWKEGKYYGSKFRIRFDGKWNNHKDGRMGFWTITAALRDLRTYLTRGR